MKNAFIAISLFSSLAMAKEIVTHFAVVKKGYDTKVCAQQIQELTTADVISINTTFDYISVKSSDKTALEIAALECVASVEKNAKKSGEQ